MSNAAFYILALTKLRQYTVAAEELTRLGDLDAAEHTEQSPSGDSRADPCTVRFGSNVKVLAKCKLEYYTISECHGGRSGCS